MAITKISFGLTVAAGSNDSCDAGIFDANLTTLLSSAGATAGKLNVAAPSVQQLTLLSTVNLVQGNVYYAAFGCGAFGTTGASVLITPLSQPSAILMGAAAPNIVQTFQAAAIPLAAPLTAAGGTGFGVLLGLLL